jgi:hypothetical protein
VRQLRYVTSKALNVVETYSKEEEEKKTIASEILASLINETGD